MTSAPRLSRSVIATARRLGNSPQDLGGQLLVGVGREPARRDVGLGLDAQRPLAVLLVGDDEVHQDVTSSGMTCGAGFP